MAGFVITGVIVLFFIFSLILAYAIHSVLNSAYQHCELVYRISVNQPISRAVAPHIYESEVLKIFGTVKKGPPPTLVLHEKITNFETPLLWSYAAGWQRFALEHGPSSLVAGGIFFTFLGIVVGLGTITTDAGASEMLKDIDALLSNLAVAFTSSLAGILGSLILLFVRSYNIAKVEMKAGVLRHTLLRQGYTWTPEQTLASIQKATEDMRQEALQIKDGINDQAERLGTMATDIASQLGTQMSQVLVPHLQSMHEGLHDFAQHQSAQQTEMLGAMAQDFAQEIQGTLHQHFEDLTQALEDSRSWYQDMHSLFTQSLQALSEQVNLQREHQQRQEAFFTKASQDMVTMSQHREDIIDKELALFEHYQAIIKRLQETGEATGQSSKLIQDSVANLESILDMHKHLQNSLLQSQDKIYEQFTQSTNTLGSVGERFREDVEAVRSELSEGLQETFKEFDTGSAAVVNHLSGSFAMMLQLLESLEKNILHMQNSVNSLEKSVQLVHKPALPSPVAAHNTPGR